MASRWVLYGLLPIVNVLFSSGCHDAGKEPGRSEQRPLHVAVSETFELSEAESWLFRTPELWKVVTEGDRRVLQMAEPPARPMMPGVRRPQEYAIYAPYEFRSFSLSCHVRVDRDPAVRARDACIIFGRQDDIHFYYAHLSGASDGVHNSLMRVDGATRTSLLPKEARPEPKMTDKAWHKVDILRDGDTGLIQVYVDAFDESARPLFEATDRTYGWGFIAIGSFDDHASFARILIEGEARKPASPPLADAPPQTMEAGGGDS